MLASSTLRFNNANLDISSLLKAADSNEDSSALPPQNPHTRSFSLPGSSSSHTGLHAEHTNTKMGVKRSLSSHPGESPAKKQSKWSPEEDALIIELRGRQMKWEDISKRLPGRSAISCRLHYQNYLERRSEWDEERKNKLARIYERFKPEIWAKIAEEMAVPWRAAEAMHWQIGESEMARRAGVIPFSLSSVPTDASSGTSTRRISPSRILMNSHNQALSSEPGVSQLYPSPRTHTQMNTSKLKSPPKNSLGCQQSSTSIKTTSHTISGGESTPRSVPAAIKCDGLALAAITGPTRGVGQQLLPSVAEMTTGVPPYMSSAYDTSVEAGYSSIGTALPGIELARSPPPKSYYQRRPEIKKKHNPAGGHNEMRRQ